MATNLFSGQGKVYVAPILASGLAGAFRWVGNVPNLTLAFDTNLKTLRESYSGQRLPLANLTTENNAKISADLHEHSPANMALALRGAAVEVDDGTVTAGQDNTPTGSTAMAVGDVWALKHQNIDSSGFSIVDSTGSPVTVNPAHYEVDLKFGTVKILNIASYVWPLKAAYTYDVTTAVGFFTKGITRLALRFEGVNTADNNRKCLAEVYNIAVDPTKELALISDDFGVLKLEGNALIDTTRDTDDEAFGPFGRIVYLD